VYCVFFCLSESVIRFHRLVLNVVLKSAFKGNCKSSLCLVVPAISPLYCDVYSTCCVELNDDDDDD